MSHASADSLKTSKAARPRVLITGAEGIIGRKLIKYLSAAGYELVLLDRSRDVGGTIFADLGYDTGWDVAFRDVDTVIHLAAATGAEATQADCLHSNIVATRAVVDACLARGVRRIVFTSSSWVMKDYEGKDIPIVEDLPPLPQTPYGHSKAWCEEELKRFPSVVCLRIGWVQPHNEKSSALSAPPLLRSLWLSDGDLCRIIECAVLAPEIDYLVCNATSRNAGSRWPIERACKILRYMPRDGIGGLDVLGWRIRRRFRKLFNLPR